MICRASYPFRARQGASSSDVVGPDDKFLFGEFQERDPPPVTHRRPGHRSARAVLLLSPCHRPEPVPAADRDRRTLSERYGNPLFGP